MQRIYNSSGRKGEELLEFSFRRIFDNMPDNEKGVIQVLFSISGTIIN